MLMTRRGSKLFIVKEVLHNSNIFATDMMMI